MRKPSGYWTFEKCAKEAKKYKTRTDFCNGTSSAYNVAKINKWLDEICKHMTGAGSYKKWSFEKCAEKAKKYKTRIAFKNGYESAYHHARINGYLDEICKHMKPIGNIRKRCIYVFEFKIGKKKYAYVGLTCSTNRRLKQHLEDDVSSVYKFIKEYKTKYTFKILTEYIDYAKASRLEGKIRKQYENNGWIALNVAKCGALGSNIVKWTKDECAKEAKKYKIRSDFKKNSGSAYNSARKNKWLDEICKHMLSRCVNNGHWNNFKNCLKEAKKYKTRSDFYKICAHMKNKMVSRGYWTYENCKKEAKKYKTRSDFQKNSGSAYTIAAKNKWLGEICEHMLVIKGYWTFEKCAKEAKKYKKRISFMNICKSAYGAAQRNGWLDDICKHMLIIKGYWTKDNCAKESKKYKTRNAFCLGSSGAYQAACKNKWMDEFYPKNK